MVHALLQRCLKLPFADMAQVPDNLRKELAGVCKACFSSVCPGMSPACLASCILAMLRREGVPEFGLQTHLCWDFAVLCSFHENVI